MNNGKYHNASLIVGSVNIRIAVTQEVVDLLSRFDLGQFDLETLGHEVDLVLRHQLPVNLRPPTVRQQRLARHIARSAGIDVPLSALINEVACAEFINTNKTKHAEKTNNPNAALTQAVPRSWIAPGAQEGFYTQSLHALESMIALRPVFDKYNEQLHTAEWPNKVTNPKVLTSCAAECGISTRDLHKHMRNAKDLLNNENYIRRVRLNRNEAPWTPNDIFAERIRNGASATEAFNLFLQDLQDVWKGVSEQTKMP